MIIQLHLTDLDIDKILQWGKKNSSLQPHGLSMEFSRLEYWSGQLLPFPGDLPNPGIKPRSPTLQVDFLPAEPQGKLYMQSLSYEMLGWMNH